MRPFFWYILLIDSQLVGYSLLSPRLTRITWFRNVYLFEFGVSSSHRLDKKKKSYTSLWHQFVEAWGLSDSSRWLRRWSWMRICKFHPPPSLPHHFIGSSSETKSEWLINRWVFYVEEVLWSTMVSPLFMFWLGSWRPSISNSSKPFVILLIHKRTTLMINFVMERGMRWWLRCMTCLINCWSGNVLSLDGLGFLTSGMTYHLCGVVGTTPNKRFVKLYQTRILFPWMFEWRTWSTSSSTCVRHSTVYLKFLTAPSSIRVFFFFFGYW